MSGSLSRGHAAQRGLSRSSFPFDFLSSPPLFSYALKFLICRTHFPGSFGGRKTPKRACLSIGRSLLNSDFIELAQIAWTIHHAQWLWDLVLLFIMLWEIVALLSYYVSSRQGRDGEIYGLSHIILSRQAFLRNELIIRSAILRLELVQEWKFSL